MVLRFREVRLRELCSRCRAVDGRAECTRAGQRGAAGSAVAGCSTAHMGVRA